jgi:hypothetical protein
MWERIRWVGLAELLATGLVAVLGPGLLSAQPPFTGTVWIESSILTPQDPTAFLGATYQGTGERAMFDRRLASGWKRWNAHLFQAKFDDGLEIEVQVNPEFTRAEAEFETQKYLPAVGRIPKVLRQDVETIWIHRGNQPFGGGNKNLLIHTDSQAYDGKYLEETLIHEAAHTSLDEKYARAEEWVAAQKRDDRFISAYAQDNPTREDIAESFLPFLAIQYRSERIDANLRKQIEQTIPNRIRFFESLKLDLHPFVESGRPRRYEWELQDGKRIYGRFVSSAPDEVQIETLDRVVHVPLSELSTTSRQLVEKLSTEPGRDPKHSTEKNVPK